MFKAATIKRSVLGLLLGTTGWLSGVAMLDVDPVPAAEPSVALAQAESGDAASPEGQSAKTEDEDGVLRTPEELTAIARESVVVVTFSGRGGRQEGLGTGFVVAPDGLIATSLHVIGQARPISVELHDGRKFEVTSIHATEKAMDLALLRIDARDLSPLELGDSSGLEPGESVIALGNPHGLKYSVVRGVASGKRTIEGRPMIQLAMPIEPGHSGGPVLDLYGRVQGILTLKHASEAIGFAVESNALKPLLAKPNPVPIAQWLTIGVLDPKQWTTLFGATWRQRAGRILVHGQGDGFGGRSLSLSNRPVPELPFEIAVDVKMEQADGAAGLAFHSDGSDRHYGFYPSNGKLRLSRFDGPDVFFWRVLREVSSAHYRPGDWNRLKIRIEPDRFLCYINDELAVEHTDSEYTAGRVGLVKFRHTNAEFKGFQVAPEIRSAKPSAEAVDRILSVAESVAPDHPASAETVESLLRDAGSGDVLRQHAERLERQAVRLRQLADDIHQKRIQSQLLELLNNDESQIDLLHAALLIARLDNRDVDVAAYRELVDGMAAELTESLTADAGEETRVEALDKFFFKAQRFHGSRTEYYNRSNSYLNEVIDDREGLPITLSVLYSELGRRIGLNVVGVGMPGRFIVRYIPKAGDGVLIDVFDGGRRINREQADEIVRSLAGRGLTDHDLEVQSKRDILVRMLRNLMGISQNSGDAEATLRYLDTIVALDPETAEYRLYRAMLRLQTERLEEARSDVDWLTEKNPAAIDPDQLRQLRRAIETAAGAD